MLKKLILGLGAGLFLGVGSVAIVNATNFNNGGFGGSQDAEIQGVSSNTMTEGGLITVIKTFINWVLGILSLIALVIVLFGGFKMVTAAGDEGKYKEGFKILQQAAVGLAIIGLSWFIVSIIFWLIRGSAGGAGATVGGGA